MVDGRRFHRQHVDGANWIVGPNVTGTGKWVVGGSLSSKPRVSGGADINGMSDEAEAAARRASACTRHSEHPDGTDTSNTS